MSLPAGFWVLAVIGVIGELGLPATPGRRERGRISFSLSTSLAILLVWGVWPALVAQTVAAAVAAARARVGPGVAALLVARAAAATAVAAAVVAGTDLDPIRRAEGIDRSDLADLIVTILAWLLAYHAPFVVAERWVRQETWRTIAGRGLGAELLDSAALLALGPVVVAEPRGWTFALLALPLVTLLQLSGLINRQAASLRLDSLTGLPNTRGLAEIARELGRSRRNEAGRYAALLVRLPTLRDIDDAFGRPVVDAVLSAAARRLADEFGPGATVGRADVDDIAVLVSASTAGGPISERVSWAVRVVTQALREPMVVDGLPYETNVIIGVARFPQDGSELLSLLRHADAAIRFGRIGPDGIAAYTPTPHEEHEQRLGLLTDLGAALRGQSGAGRIEFAYQPQVRLDSGAVVAVEALLRWTHPVRGAVPAEELFRVAEPTPVMHDLSRLAVATVTSQLRQWNDRGIHLRAAVNLSMRDLHQEWLVDEILDRIGRAGVADQLVVEVTEGEVIQDPEQVGRTVDRLAGAGIHVAVDDFGSGFASLQHLRRLRLDQLKIDKSLVGGIATNLHDRAVVRSVIELGHALGLTLVAEGVEDQAVHRTLRELGCQMGQGWWYGRPAAADEIAELVQRAAPPPDRRVGQPGLTRRAGRRRRPVPPAPEPGRRDRLRGRRFGRKHGG